MEKEHTEIDLYLFSFTVRNADTAIDHDEIPLFALPDFVPQHCTFKPHCAFGSPQFVVFLWMNAHCQLLCAFIMLVKGDSPPEIPIPC
mmetsp:Transcript_28803/g.77602  ORF Transcript_28803/g.77602 Transcript_28803/m.77602 type:complete len:88 (+) Transcript_28803:1598-1861(+)|eukprot:577652-Pelagomonas_calceolata.AAC.3